MQDSRKMASVEDYPYDQSMFKFSNPPTASGTIGDLNGFGFPTNQIEYFNLGQPPMNLEPMINHSYDLASSTMDPLSNVSPSIEQHQQQPPLQQPVFLSNANLLDLNQTQQIIQPQLSHPLSSTDDSSSSLTPFDQSVSSSTAQFSNSGFISEDSVFPPVDAFIPSSIDTQHQQQQHQFHLQKQNQVQGVKQEHFQRSRYLSEPNIMTSTSNDSPFSLSPQSITFGSNPPTSATTITTTTTLYDSNVKPLYQRYRVIRGISSGGSATKPPRIMTTANHHYVPVNLELLDANLQECCLPTWNEEEKADKRRIIRIERYQVGSKIIAKFSIVGSAKENPTPLDSQPGVDVVEVSCLECFTKQSEDTDNEEESGNSTPMNNYSYGSTNTNGVEETKRSFYITSVEVIKIVELLIGTEVQDPAEHRRERGRIRSNLVPFWSKRPISSRMSNNEMRSNSSSPKSESNNSFNQISNISPDYSDFRIELATRIMAYDVRKPRGFDKEVRILKWEKLIPALRRALQSYYAEIPDGQDDF